ncbi:tyrosine-type recombinase/integrase [Pseudomonadota bacterium]
MAHLRDKLSDSQVKHAKPRNRPYKLSDGAGMYLLVNPNGGKYWRLKYRFGGKEKVLALGVYPDVKLKGARDKVKKARALLDDQQDPGLIKKEEKRQNKIQAANTFEGVAREWHRKQKHRWTQQHADKVINSLEQNVFAALRDRPIAEITPAELLDVLRVIESRGALELASNVLQRCNAVFRYAIASLRAERNPAADLKGALKPPKPKNYPSLTVDDLPKFLEKLDHFRGDKITELAIRLLMLTFVRTKELRMAEWSEFDMEERLWRVPAERMKMGVEHLVPLSDQAIECLDELREISGQYHLLFPGRSNVNTPMSYNTILYGIYRMGFKGKATGHGFRSTASTILNEMQFPSDAIERQLAHGERDKVRAAYNKAQYLEKRKEMMQEYANYLDNLKTNS